MLSMNNFKLHHEYINIYYSLLSADQLFNAHLKSYMHKNKSTTFDVYIICISNVFNLSTVKHICLFRTV